MKNGRSPRNRPQRLILFGSADAVARYARRHDLALGAWYHASSRERVIGIDPAQFSQTVIVDEENLDERSREALREWDIRRNSRL